VNLARHALPADRSAIIDTLADAFATDPFWMYLLADGPQPVPSMTMREVMALEHDAHVTAGHTYVVDDRAAALWEPPGVQCDLGPVGGFLADHVEPERLTRAMEAFAETADWRPSEPHFYLHLIGARSEARGQGIGSTMLRRVLSICDSESIPAFLEASSPRNADLYLRHGFETLATISVDDNVALRAMVRWPYQQQQSSSERDAG